MERAEERADAAAVGPSAPGRAAPVRGSPPPSAWPGEDPPVGPGTVAAVAFGLLVVVLALNGRALLLDTDTSWHLASAEWMVDNGRLPTEDVFSFTRTGDPWIAKEWLSQLLLLAGWRVAGWGGVVLLTATAAAAAFGLLAGELRRRLSLTATVVAVGVAFVLAAPHLLARPHTLVLPVAVAWTAVLVRAVDERPGDPPWRALPLLVLWVNLHASFPLGVALAAGLALDAVVRSRRRGEPAVGVRRWGGFVAASVLATVATPYGWRPLLVTIEVLGLGPALGIIGEWMPQDFGTLGVFEVVLLAGVGGALVAGVRLPWPRVLVLLGLLHLALSAVRNGELLGLLGPLLVAAPLASQRPRLASRGEHPGARATGSRRSLPALGVAVAGVAAGGLVLLALPPRPSPVLEPVAATAAARAAGSQRLLHEYAWGGYLVRAGVPTFVDGRTELFGGPFVVAHDEALRLVDVELLERLLVDHRIDATMLRPSTPAVDLLDRSAGWRRVHTDDVAVVHVRVGAGSTVLVGPAPTDG